MGGEWLCSFSRLSTEPEALLGRLPSVDEAKQLAEQHAHAHQCQPRGAWVQAESAWFLEATCGTYIVARAPGREARPARTVSRVGGCLWMTGSPRSSSLVTTGWA